MTQDLLELTTSAPEDPLIGQMLLGRYRVVRVLGQGGMGVVYLGRTEGAAGFSRPVVIKRVLPQLLGDPGMAKFIVREARILAHLHHHGIVGVLDLGEEDGAYIMVLEYVHGYDLALWLRYLGRNERRLPVDIALHIGICVLEALQYAHNLTKPDGTPMQVVHRDVSPSNVLLDVEGHIRILDFGIARIENELTEFKTQDSSFKGKVGYSHISLLSDGKPSPQTDTYSAALVTFQLIAGVNPYRGATTVETISRIVNGAVPSLSDYRTDIPAGLDDLFKRALAQEVSAGFQSAQALAEELRGFLSVSAATILSQMVALIRQDFCGSMAEQLGIEPLDERSAAWRRSEGVTAPSKVTLRSTRPPPRRAREEKAPLKVVPTNAQRLFDPDAETLLELSAEVTPSAAVQSQPGIPRPGRSGLVVALAALAVAVAGVGLVLAFRSGGPVSDQARYLVVEQNERGQAPSGIASQPSAEAEPAAAPTVAEEERQAPNAAPPNATAQNLAGATRATTSRAVEPDPAKLTRTFSARQGRVHACLSKDPSAPNNLSLEIAFAVDTSGRVTQANLSPAGVAGTVAGSCILGVARSTRFGPLTRDARFRIPVSARRR